jgi:hypothetical protein
MIEVGRVVDALDLSPPLDAVGSVIQQPFECCAQSCVQADGALGASQDVDLFVVGGVGGPKGLVVCVAGFEVLDALG